MIEFKVLGLEDIRKGLAELPPRVALKVLRKGVYAGAALLRGAVKQAAPVRSYGGQKKMSSGGDRQPGYLKKSIGAKFKKGEGQNVKTYRVGPYGQGFYGYFVEAGHAAGKRKKYGRGVTAQTGLRMVPAHPFIMPVFNSMSNQVVERMKEKLSELIVKEGQEMGFKAKQ